MMSSMSSTSLVDVFKLSIFYRRCTKCICTILVFQFVFALGVIVILKLGQSPLKILDIWQVFLNFTNWFYLLALSVCAIAISSFHIHRYSVTHEVLLTRWDIAWKLIKPSSLVSVLFILTVSGVMVRCYLGLLNDTISHLLLYSDDKFCLNEQHIFVVLHGVYSGAYYGILYNLFSKNELIFPVVQQSKHLQVNLIIPKLLYDAFICIIHKLKWFYILYYFFGSYARLLIMDLLNVKKCCGDVSLTSFTGLIDFELFWISWVTSSFVFFIWNIAVNLFNIYLTEHNVFPVETRIADQNIITLNQALALHDVPLIQYLGYMDLHLLSQNHPVRRKQIYSLSHPGGHPYNWKSICNECLSLLDNFVNLLNSSNNEILTAPIDNIKKERNFLEPKTNPALNAELKMRHFSSSAHSYSRDIYRENPIVHVKMPPAVMIKKWCLRKMDHLWITVQDWFALLHLFRKSKHPCSHHLLANCQPHIWAVRAISSLSMFSITEDKYGVVQQDLADIISVLCDLHHIIEKKQKWITRTNRIISLQWDIKYMRCLLSETKSALCKLAIVFQNHLDGIKMSPDHKRLLQQYANYE